MYAKTYLLKFTLLDFFVFWYEVQTHQYKDTKYVNYNTTDTHNIEIILGHLGQMLSIH